MWECVAVCVPAWSCVYVSVCVYVCMCSSVNMRGNQSSANYLSFYVLSLSGL